MSIIQAEKILNKVKFKRIFFWKDGTGGGFGFDCTEEGILIHLSALALKNYLHCLTGELDVTDGGVVKYNYRFTQDAIIKCECGREIRLGYTNKCPVCHNQYDNEGNLIERGKTWEE